MPRSDLFRSDRRRQTPWPLTVSGRGPGRGPVLRPAGTPLAFPAAAALCGAAFFFPAIPFALALLPLLAGLWSGARTARFIAMTGFLVWPVFLSAWGLAGLEAGRPDLIWGLATGFVLLAGLLAAQIGILPATLLLTLIPVFPASPLLPLAALLPGLGLMGLFGASVILTLIEATRARKKTLLGLITACLMIWSSAHMLLRDTGEVESRTGWRALAEPQAITERGRWLALRATLPDGATVILGENVFMAHDTEARAFWCRTVRAGAFTLYSGVAERYGAATRGAVWKLDADSCARGPRPAHSPAVHRATVGIPHLTGGWGPMQRGTVAGTGGGTHPGPDVDWLICLEAFLPWAWAGLLAGPSPEQDTPRPVIVLANDTAFRSLPALKGPPPVHVLRRKAALAMAGLAGRDVLFAETGRTLLLRDAREASRATGPGPTTRDRSSGERP